jgi:tRNA(fMet)-specific endonuclease VapC
VSVAELLFGALKRRSQRLEAEINGLVADMHVTSFDEPAAHSYAVIRTELEVEGRPLDDSDLRIAAICLAHEFRLVSGNVRHFERVPGLRVENWLT